MIQRSRQVLLALLVSCLWGLPAPAQELRAEVDVRTSFAQGTTNAPLPPTLRQQLFTLLNQTRWTELTYAPHERVEVQLTLTLTGQTSEGLWRGELALHARRPVYHSDYKTTTLLLRDTEVAFPYGDGTPLLYRGRDTEHPLVMLLAYYALYVLANDLDGFSPLGGDQLAPTLLELAREAEGHPDWTGWQSLGRGNERRRLLERFELAEEQALRQAWYSYHRLGLDQLADDPEEARRQLLQSLVAFHDAAPQGFPSPTLLQLQETKLSELIATFQSSPPEQRSAVRELLQQLSPGAKDALRRLQ